jgi:hypothetical protein
MFIAAAAMLLAGCAASRPLVQTTASAEPEAAAQEPAADRETVDEFPVGRWCEVRLKDRRTVYSGTIARASAEEVVLAEGWKRETSPVPVLGSVPYVRWLFEPKGLGPRVGERPIRRDSISAIAVHSTEETEKILAQEAANRAKPAETETR